jgi:hypothetical protein
VRRAKGHRCLPITNDGEVREMRDAATVLEIIRERGRRGLPLERVYRCLFNRDLYLLAYGKLYRNAGAMTPGATRETVDGMNLGKIEAIITALRQERYRWTPVRRTYIEKKGTTRKRPLGLPTWSDKLLQEVLRLVLEAYYEPAVLRPFPWIPSGVGMSHRATGDHPSMARDGVVHRGRYLQLLWIFGPLDHEIDSGREDSRRAVSSPDR